METIELPGKIKVEVERRGRARASVFGWPSSWRLWEWAGLGGI